MNKQKKQTHQKGRTGYSAQTQPGNIGKADREKKTEPETETEIDTQTDTIFVEFVETYAVNILSFFEVIKKAEAQAETGGIIYPMKA